MTNPLQNVTFDTNAVRFYNRAAFFLLLFLLLLRFITATQFGLAWDEAYYWQWSRHLALCYYDAGPGIALTIRAGTMLLGNNPFGVRFVPILMSVIAYGLMYDTARRWFDVRVAFYTLVLASVAPLLAIGSVLATYDLPQVFFWAAALYTVTRAVEETPDSKPNPLFWYLTGVLVGLGTLTKPTMIFFAPGVLILLALVPAYRKHLTSPHPYLAFLLTFLCLAPIFIWNAGHDNVNWIHTLNRGNRSSDAPFGRWLGEFWGGQAIIVGPFLLLVELYAIYRALRRPQEPANAFLIAFTVPILTICTLISFRSKVEVNWPVAAHLTGLLAIAALAPPARKVPWGMRLATAFSALLTMVLFLPNVLVIRPFGPFVSNGTWEKVNEQYGWETIARAVVEEREKLKAESGTTPVFIAGTGYRVCSVLSFYLPGQPFVEKIQIPDTRHDQYNLWTNEARLIGQNAVVSLDKERSDEEAYLRSHFVSISQPVIVNVPRPSFLGPIKSWYVYRCYGLKK